MLMGREFCLVFDREKLLTCYYKEGIKVSPTIVEYTYKPLVMSFTILLILAIFSIKNLIMI
jgi:hypothetical protein